MPNLLDNKIAHREFVIDVKSFDESGTFEGKLAVYGNVDLGGDLIEPGAFTKTLQEKGGRVPLLWDHNLGLPIGSLELTDTPGALMAKGSLMINDIPKAREVYALMKAGIVSGLSIGYRAIKAQGVGAVRHLREVRLYEGSLTVIPLNSEAMVTALKHDDISLTPEPEGTPTEPLIPEATAETKTAEPVLDHSLLDSLSQLLRT